MNSMVLLTEIYSRAHGSQKSYSLREIYINPSHVCFLRSDTQLRDRLSKGDLIDGLDQRCEFTNLMISSSNSLGCLKVVGDVETIAKKLKTGVK